MDEEDPDKDVTNCGKSAKLVKLDPDADFQVKFAIDLGAVTVICRFKKRNKNSYNVCLFLFYSRNPLHQLDKSVFLL